MATRKIEQSFQEWIISLSLGGQPPVRVGDKFLEVWVDVTGEIAEKLLQRNSHNREFKNVEVARFCRDLKLGEFRETHQGLATTWDGIVIDGANRLKAISKTGISRRLRITLGMTYEDQQVCDIGSKRTGNDALRMACPWMSGDMRRLTGLLTRMQENLVIKWSSVKPSDMVQVGERYHEGIKFGGTIFSGKSRKCPHAVAIVKPCVMAVAARAYYLGEMEHVRLKEFFNSTYSGTEAGGGPVATALGRLLIERHQKVCSLNGGGQQEIYSYVESYLRCFLTGSIPLDESGVVQIAPATRELFPLAGWEELSFNRKIT